MKIYQIFMWIPYLYVRIEKIVNVLHIWAHIPESLMVQSERTKCCFVNTTTDSIAWYDDRKQQNGARKKWFFDFDASNLYLSYVRSENACSFFDLTYCFQQRVMRIDVPLLQHTFCRFSSMRQEVHQQSWQVFFSLSGAVVVAIRFSFIYFARLFFRFGWFTILQYFSLSTSSVCCAVRWRISKMLGHRLLVSIPFKSHTRILFFYSNRIVYLMRYKMFISACFLPFHFSCRWNRGIVAARIQQTCFCWRLVKIRKFHFLFRCHSLLCDSFTSNGNPRHTSTNYFAVNRDDKQKKTAHIVPSRARKLYAGNATETKNL